MDKHRRGEQNRSETGLGGDIKGLLRGILVLPIYMSWLVVSVRRMLTGGEGGGLGKFSEEDDVLDLVEGHCGRKSVERWWSLKCERVVDG